MDKQAMRNATISILKKFSSEKKMRTEKKLLHHLVNSSIWNGMEVIGITISQGFEWNTRPIIERGWEEGKTICVPKCYPKTKQLKFYQLDSYQQLEKSYYNLMEPIVEKSQFVHKNDIHVMIVPGVVFDTNGYRIGFGGGYYDRFLTDFTNDTISLIHTEQLVDAVPKESFDIPVQHIITENGWLNKH